MYAEGTTLLFYATATITANDQQPVCAKGEKICKNGIFVSTATGANDLRHLTCRRIDPTDTTTALCAFEGDAYLPGEVVYRYASATATLDQDCKQTVSVCNGNGTWWTGVSGYNAGNCTFVRDFSAAYLKTNEKTILDSGTKLPTPESLSCVIGSGNSCVTPR